MEDLQFNKNKYVFSSKNISKTVNEKILEKQIQFYKRELKVYKVSLNRLISEYPSTADKDLILNIAYGIIEDEIILNRMKKTKVLPIENIARYTEISKSFIQKWEAYIIAYTILLYTDKYIDIYNYLNITFRELEVLSLVTTTNDTNLIFKGIVVENNRRTSIILTSKGEFIKINQSSDIIGRELSGKEKNVINKYRNTLVLIFIIVSMIIGGIYYNFNQQASTIIVQGTSNIKFDINKYNRVIFSSSPTEKGKSLLIGLDHRNKDVETVMDNLFRKMQEMKMIPPNRRVEIIITGERIEKNKFELLQQYIKELKSDDDYNNNIDVIINNAGYESTLR